MGQAWIVGEALIDSFTIKGVTRRHMGGGAANTALALANLGCETFFIGGISNDAAGRFIEKELEKVDLTLANRSKLPTALAQVTLDERGLASYKFRLKGSATFEFNGSWLPEGNPEVIHIGTLATIIEPGASELFEWADRYRGRIIFDPNIRPSVISDMSKYRSAVERWVGKASVVKLSEEDFEHLGYSDPSQLLNLGCDLVVLTRGAAGISAFTRSNTFSVPGVSVEVIDTVGAGDTVGAVLVEALINQGFFGLISGNLELVLKRAAIAAAICCARAGAKPPTAAEIETFLN